MTGQPLPPRIPPLIPGSQTPEPAPVNRLRWWIHLGLVTGYLLLMILLGARRGHTGPALTHGVSGLLLTSTLHLLLFALVLLGACVVSRASRDDLLLRWRPGFWTVPLGIGYSIALRLALAFVLAGAAIFLLVTRTTTPETIRTFVTRHQPDVTTLVDMSAMRKNPAYFWLTVTFVSFIVAGLREELWRSAFMAGLRALWPQTFGSRIGQIGAVALAAILFGLGHLQLGPFGMLFAGILGFGLGLIMVLHRSVWPAVIAHGVFDATTLALLPWVMEKLHS